MSTHNICFYAEIREHQNVTKYSSLTSPLKQECRTKSLAYLCETMPWEHTFICRDNRGLDQHVYRCSYICLQDWISHGQKRSRPAYMPVLNWSEPLLFHSSRQGAFLIKKHQKHHGKVLSMSYFSTKTRGYSLQAPWCTWIGASNEYPRFEREIRKYLSGYPLI